MRLDEKTSKKDVQKCGIRPRYKKGEPGWKPYSEKEEDYGKVGFEETLIAEDKENRDKAELEEEVKVNLDGEEVDKPQLEELKIIMGDLKNNIEQGNGSRNG